MKWQERAGPMAREHSGLLHRVGALMQPRSREEPAAAAEPRDEGAEALHARRRGL